MKNPYAVLGVPRDADEKAIKEAYRKLARKYHPDVNPGDKNAEERFKDIQTSYDLLSDPQKRAEWDQFGSRGFPRGAGSGFDPRQARHGRVPSFDEIFGSGALQDILANLFGGGFAAGRGTPPPAPPAEGEIEVSFEEAYRGTEKELEVRGPTGTALRQVRVRIPRGVEDGALLRVPSVGRPGQEQEIFLRVRMRPDPRFERRGADVYHDLALSLTEAALGAEVEVPTPAGSARVRVPPGTPSGRSIRLAGHGFPDQSGASGDLYARIRIVPDPSPSEEERRLLEELSRLSRFNPRPGN